MALPATDETSVHGLIDGSRISVLQCTVFAVCFVMNALDGMDVLVISYAAPQLTQEWQISPQALGAVFSAGLLGMTCGAMFIAPYADRIGRRMLIQLSIVLTGTGVLATAWAANLQSLIALRFVSGMGIGAMLASVATMAAEYAPARQRNLILSVVLAGYPVGATLFGLVAADVIPLFGWSTIFLIAGLITLATLPLVWWLLPESLSYLLTRKDPTAIGAVNRIVTRMNGHPLEQLPVVASAGNGGRVGRLFQGDLRASTWLLWLAFFMNFAALYFLTSWIPKLANAAGLALELAIYAGTVFNLGAILGIVSCGVLSERFGLRRTIAGFLLFTALLMCLFAWAQGTVMTLLLFGLIGFFIQGGFVGLYAVAARLYETRIRTTGVGWAIGAGRTGAIVGPFVGGMMVAAQLDIGTNFRWFSIALVMAALFTLLIRERHLNH